MGGDGCIHCIGCVILTKMGNCVRLDQRIKSPFSSVETVEKIFNHLFPQSLPAIETQQLETFKCNSF